MIDPDDRDAYENGQEDRAEILNDPIGFMLDIPGAIETMGYSESERAAYDKGISGEQLDGDK